MDKGIIPNNKKQIKKTIYKQMKEKVITLKFPINWITLDTEDAINGRIKVKAIEYPDGWGLYVLDGVVLSEDLWKKIISQTMTFKEIMAIEISDQRTVALKYNPEAVIKENARLVHKDDRHNELYLIENQQLNKDLDFPKIWFLKMLCPTGRTFIEGVPPDEAEKNPNATDMQAILCGLTKSEYAVLLES